MKITTENIQVSNVSLELNKAIKLYRQTFGIAPSEDEGAKSELEVLCESAGMNLVETCPSIIHQNQNAFVNDVRIGPKLTLEDKVKISADLRQYLETVLDYMMLLEVKYKTEFEEKKKENKR